MCSGARDYRCWNVVTCDGLLAARRIVEALLREIESLPDFDHAFRERVRADAVEKRSEKAERVKALERELEDRARKIDRLLDVIESNADSKAMSERLKILEAEKDDLERERAKLRAEPDDVPDLPSLDILKEQAREKIGRLDFADPEVGRLLSLLCPAVEFLPFELFGSGSRDLRAYVTVNLAPLFAPAHAAALGDVFVRKVVVDAFDSPIHVRLRHDILKLYEGKMHLRDIAEKLDIAFGSVQNTLEFHRRLERAGLTDPYSLLTEAPVGKNGRYCRHLHVRYRFTPLPGYPKWPVTEAV